MPAHDPDPPPFGPPGLRGSFTHAFRGLFLLLKREPNARIHAVLSAAACLLAWALDLSAGEWLAVLLCIGLVFTTESLNSAIEKLADRVTMLKDPVIRDAKDLAAAGVLCAAVISAIVGAIVFLPKAVSLLRDGSAGP